jgi:membrane protein implicated in regulation of membrane protease activity
MTFYRWSMRYGAAILFVIALVQLVIGLIGPVHMLLTTTGRMASDLGYTPDRPSMQLELQLQLVMNAITTAALPLFGALVINRLDRQTAPKNEAEPFE